MCIAAISVSSCCTNSFVSGRHWSYPSPRAPAIFLPPLPLSLKGRDLIKTSYLVSVPRTLPHCILSKCWALHLLPHLWKEEASRMMAKEKLIYEHSRISLGVILWLWFMSRICVFDFVPRSIVYLILWFLATKTVSGIVSISWNRP